MIFCTYWHHSVPKFNTLSSFSSMENHNGSISAGMQKELLKINHVPCKSTYIRYGKDPHSMAIFRASFPAKTSQKILPRCFSEQDPRDIRVLCKRKGTQIGVAKFCLFFQGLGLGAKRCKRSFQVSKCLSNESRTLVYLNFNKSTGHEYLDHFSSLLFLNECSWSKHFHHFSGSACLSNFSPSHWHSVFWCQGQFLQRFFAPQKNDWFSHKSWDTSNSMPLPETSFNLQQPIAVATWLTHPQLSGRIIHHGTSGLPFQTDHQGQKRPEMSKKKLEVFFLKIEDK